MKALLALENGFTLEGSSFTGEFETGGEVIFNTGMTGYQEILTDPSYCGQLVCLTYPLIGNYGITAEDMESDGIHMRALLVKECCKEPSNWRSVMSLPEFMKSRNVPGMEGLDTRALTIVLREHGSMRGMISTKDLNPESLVAKARALPSMEGQNLVPYVAPKGPYIWHNGAPKPVTAQADGRLPFVSGETPRAVRLLVYDFGIKWNIIRELIRCGFAPVMVPPDFPAEAARASGAQAVFLSNGPGDPATLTDVIANVRELMKTFPMAGICLGHQLIGLALGGTTRKMKFGHHGCNHPVKDLATGHVEISSQNHGFCVVIDGCEHIETTHVNLNDGTLEGLYCPDRRVMSVQYHPEAAAGPHDSHYLFGRFHKMISDNLAD
ncbi:MAG TPA: glutamine-hydrolyzing carbamoyl-phosphate synthase small subunit [Candidatus Desulfovibrio intestinipullorum]|uniref:Carbamoyl phosphate synthase small chain n=1 Tax=Candidatus Desulfovibrio intestinipullorum TaxID=2838536 RepID=A0A9D1TNV4_9BACT|nr:glutamine-hydrolyzing carbamoyl-phosphate synthase small subunit [Candidatus Desulfovibrio intestinipullorum]